MPGVRNVSSHTTPTSLSQLQFKEEVVVAGMLSLRESHWKGNAHMRSFLCHLPFYPPLSPFSFPTLPSSSFQAFSGTVIASSFRRCERVLPCPAPYNNLHPQIRLKLYYLE
ncbi:hypothetical protein, unlikely [Trypanosoma brucei gambiense DAL972]|uniref:Uncharacterized protein n=1 Tax=Trypanosoma brucei gambiense (strain MHOM/CI/86/DAL972) TaxID=679716 RepID=C9ZJX1_TRYB9|nr:hypothetical protein, unlikely [Trypanosoma brucei gambiense DAL972]CBH09735.1 hypothetical protein, unlikely [Trypanosoma brucei gambiense DAL972]|eukprot:XP_011772028.1 hypothetical protein, unlikely [Trypanosoma brucei gambiense DAL972]